MDIILKPIVNFIQGLDGMSNAILAGGAVRDRMFGLEPRDYDIFVPAKDKKTLRKAVELIAKEFTTHNITNKSRDYGLGTPRIEGTQLLEVLNFKYKEMDIDIVGVIADDDEDFAVKTIETFDYGINMVYDTGRYVDDSHQFFRRDFETHYMTLRRISSLDQLPKAIKRFENFNQRVQEALGYSFFFDSTALTLTQPRSFNKDRYEKKYKSTLDNDDDFDIEEVAVAPTAIPLNTLNTIWNEAPAPQLATQANVAGAHTHTFTQLGIATGVPGTFTVDHLNTLNNLLNNET